MKDHVLSPRNTGYSRTRFYFDNCISRTVELAFRTTRSKVAHLMRNAMHSLKPQSAIENSIVMVFAWLRCKAA